MGLEDTCNNASRYRRRGGVARVNKDSKEKPKPVYKPIQADESCDEGPRSKSAFKEEAIEYRMGAQFRRVTQRERFKRGDCRIRTRIAARVAWKAVKTVVREGVWGLAEPANWRATVTIGNLITFVFEFDPFLKDEDKKPLFVTRNAHVELSDVNEEFLMQQIQPFEAHEVPTPPLSPLTGPVHLLSMDADEGESLQHISTAMAPEHGCPACKEKKRVEDELDAIHRRARSSTLSSLRKIITKVTTRTSSNPNNAADDGIGGMPPLALCNSPASIMKGEAERIPRKRRQTMQSLARFHTAATAKTGRSERLKKKRANTMISVFSRKLSRTPSNECAVEGETELEAVTPRQTANTTAKTTPETDPKPTPESAHPEPAPQRTVRKRKGTTVLNFLSKKLTRTPSKEDAAEEAMEEAVEEAVEEDAELAAAITRSLAQTMVKMTPETAYPERPPPTELVEAPSGRLVEKDALMRGALVEEPEEAGEWDPIGYDSLATTALATANTSMIALHSCKGSPNQSTVGGSPATNTESRSCCGLEKKETVVRIEEYGGLLPESKIEELSLDD